MSINRLRLPAVVEAASSIGRISVYSTEFVLVNSFLVVFYREESRCYCGSYATAKAYYALHFGIANIVLAALYGRLVEY